MINTVAKGFYTHLGFKCTGEFTFSGHNPKHYTGFDKTIERGMQDDSLIPRFR